uniref:hypothetical protein n=1 Tax=Caballeronia temeraria TaxID=1777137 RepID=UPI0031338BB3
MRRVNRVGSSRVATIRVPLSVIAVRGDRPRIARSSRAANAHRVAMNVGRSSRVGMIRVLLLVIVVRVDRPKIAR